MTRFGSSSSDETFPSTLQVVAPASLGRGGLGRAAQDAVDGFRSIGWSAHFEGGGGPSALRRAAGHRPFSRIAFAQRELDRSDLLNSLGATPGLRWAVPGYLGQAQGVLHQATEHPDTVARAIRHAVAREGGGRGFQSGWERRRYLQEIEDALVVRTESRRTMEDLVQRGVDPRKLVMVEPGVDSDRFTPQRRESSTQIAFVGSLSLWKGVAQLVQLDALLPPGRLQVMGGPVCPWSRRLSAHLEHTKHVSVPELLGSSHALVLPSVTEGYGYVVLEAMASGAVPFVTPHVGAADLVRSLDSRLVVSREDFAERVAQLLEQLDLVELGRRARSIALTRDRLSRAVLVAQEVVSRLNEARR